MNQPIMERLHGWRNARDQLVIDAINAGISVRKIHLITGIARTTIDRIVERATLPGPENT